MRRLLFFVNLWIGLAALAKEPPVAVDFPGARTNGFVQLPNQWFLHPAGKQLVVGDFPVNIAVHPDGKYAAVLHSGNSQNEVVIFEIANAKVVSRAEIDESFYGLQFSEDGRTLVCSGAGSEVLHVFS